MAGGVHHLDAKIADFQLLTMRNMTMHVRRRRMAFHHHLRISEVGQVPRAAAMVSMSVGVDRVLDAKPVVRGDRDVAAGVFLERIDDRSTPRAFASKQISLALA